MSSGASNSGLRLKSHGRAAGLKKRTLAVSASIARTGVVNFADLCGGRRIQRVAQMTKTTTTANAATHHFRLRQIAAIRLVIGGAKRTGKKSLRHHAR